MLSACVCSLIPLQKDKLQIAQGLDLIKLQNHLHGTGKWPHAAVGECLLWEQLNDSEHARDDDVYMEYNQYS